MDKSFKVVLIALIFIVVIFPGCKKNKKPDTPSIPTGPTSGSINTEYTFTSSAEDPDDDSVAIRIDWGDEDTSNWCSFVPCGDSISMSHSWSDSGTYSIKAQAQDLKEAVSSWSDGHQIMIGTAIPTNNPPNTPITPRGASFSSPNCSCSFISSATDPDGDSIAIRFDWGDGEISGWSDWQVSGDSISMTHSWSDTGTYSIKAQAKDKKDTTSNWSAEYQIEILAVWTKTFGGSSDDEGYSVQQTTDGGYIIAGATESYGAGGKDVYLIKTDANGNEQWYQRFGGSDDDMGYSVQQTTDSGYIIAGSHRWGSDYDVYLIKTDADGFETWYKYFGSDDPDVGYSVQQTTDYGYIITGYSDYEPGGRNVYLVKADADGNRDWVNRFGGENYDEGQSVQQSSDGGYIIAGVSDYGAGGFDVYLVKADANGNRVWVKRFGGSDVDWGYSVQQTTDGGYIITGYTRSYGAGGEDVYLIKTDANGDSIWTKTFGGSADDRGYSVQQTMDGGYIIAGATESYGAGGKDVYLIKTDANGNQQWYKTFGGLSNDVGWSVQQTSDGGYIITGYTRSYGAGDTNVYLIKTDANGNVEQEGTIVQLNFSQYLINCLDKKEIGCIGI